MYSTNPGNSLFAFYRARSVAQIALKIYRVFVPAYADPNRAFVKLCRVKKSTPFAEAAVLSKASSLCRIWLQF